MYMKMKQYKKGFLQKKETKKKRVHSESQIHVGQFLLNLLELKSDLATTLETPQRVAPIRMYA